MITIWRLHGPWSHRVMKVEFLWKYTQHIFSGMNVVDHMTKHSAETRNVGLSLTHFINSLDTTKLVICAAHLTFRSPDIANRLLAMLVSLGMRRLWSSILSQIFRNHSTDLLCVFMIEYEKSGRYQYMHWLDWSSDNVNDIISEVFHQKKEHKVLRLTLIQSLIHTNRFQYLITKSRSYLTGNNILYVTILSVFEPQFLGNLIRNLTVEEDNI